MPQKLEEPQHNIATPFDSAQYKTVQTDSVKDSGSSLIDSDKTKTKLVDTAGIKQQAIKSTKSKP